MVQRDDIVAHDRMAQAFDRLGSTIRNFHGDVREVRGDALVAEFPRASDAVTAAMDFQEANTLANEELDNDICPQVRIGIAIGEVLMTDDTVTGEGIVIAQRLEQLARPGGICVQGAAIETIPKSMPFFFENLGAHQLKGFSEPIRVYAVQMAQGPSGEVGYQNEPVTEWDRPSIAVMPFENRSGDPEQAYFSDGIAEDIITALSKVSSLVVIARSSTFEYQGRDVEVRQVGRELGVRYVLEGSVRKSGNRIRVSAHLVDAKTGHHVWADRYDRQLDDVFQVQDELMREIVIALDVKLREGEQLRMWSSGTDNVEAWECVRLSAPIILSNVRQELARARQWLERAIQLDPEYASAWMMMGWYHQNAVDIATGALDSPARDAALDGMRECAARAIEIDPQCADAYSVMALYHMELKQFDEALANAERSIECAPGNAENLCEAAGLLVKCGKPREALELAHKAIRLCPMYRAGFLRALAYAYRFSGELDKAADTMKEAVRRQPDLLSGHVNLASVLGEQGRLEEAREAATGVLRLSPEFSIGSYAAGLAYRNPGDLKRITDGLEKAGLPA